MMDDDTCTLTKQDKTKKKKHEVTTVKFNVGGKIYEISQSLLDSYPNTMLSKAASETWTQQNNNDTDPIFIERNCDRFQYILDYMRDGYISLPHNMITKEVVLNDLLYFGFENVDSDNIKVIYSPSLAASIIAKYYKMHPVILKNLDLEMKYTNLAFKCFDNYIKTSTLEMEVLLDDYQKYGNVSTHDTLDEWRESKGPSEVYQQNSLLKKCAAKFGLYFISSVNCFTTGVKYNRLWYIKFGFSEVFKY